MNRLPEALACLTEAGGYSLAPEAWVGWWREVTAPYASGARVENRVHVTDAGVSTSHVGPGFSVGIVATQKWAALNPVEAWERLATAGIIPNDAVGNPRRAFVCSRQPCDCHGEATPPHPMTLPDVVALASRWSEVLAVEELARVAVEELRTWVRARGNHVYPIPLPVERVVWRVGQQGIGSEWIDVSVNGNNPLASIARNGTLWRADGGVSPAVAAIWSAGFALDRIDDGTVTLTCPPAGTP